MNKLNKIKINTSVGIQCEENPVKKEKKKQKIYTQIIIEIIIFKIGRYINMYRKFKYTHKIP